MSGGVRCGEESAHGTDTPLFRGYRDSNGRHADAFDEMFHRAGTVRSPYWALYDAIASTAAADLAARSEALDRAHLDQGVTFSLSAT